MNDRAFRFYKFGFLMPGLLGLLAIIIFPLVFTIRLSLSGWNAGSPGINWVGGQNYVMLFSDMRFWHALERLGALAFGTVAIEYVLGFGLALLVWREIRFRRFFRVLFLIPMMTTPVIVTIIWRTIFHESLGPVNNVLGLLGLGPYPWLTSGPWAIASVVIVQVWLWTPFMFLLLLAGLISLPREPFQAAAIDGAGPIRTFFNVTFPLLAPISILAIVIRLIEASKMLNSIYVLTSGGPGTATETTGYYIYLRGITRFDVGYAAALSVADLVIVIVVLSVLARVLARLFGGART